MAHLYFAEHADPGAFELDSTLEVTGEEARHALRVSRLRVGERTLIGDGAGTIGAGEVIAADRDRFTVRFDELHREPHVERELVLVQALAKGDRDERAIEQASEFGVDRIVPWEAERSVSRWDAQKRDRGVEKWQRIAREAAKQSIRAWIPVVSEPVRLDGLCSIASRPHTAVLVLHPKGTETLSAWAANGELDHLTSIHLVVGPEGGLSDHEIERLADSGAQVLVLGSTVLRTSSAGPAALAVLNVALGRW